MTFEQWLNEVRALTTADIDLAEAQEWYGNGEEPRTFAYIITPQGDEPEQEG